MRHALAISLILFALPLAADEFRVDRVLESLTGTWRHSTQLINGIEVVGGEKIEHIRRDGTSEVVLERALKKAPVSIMAAATTPRANATRVYLDVNGEARLAWKTIAYERPLEPFAEYYDASTGALLRRDPLFWTAKARVFDPNPVVKLNDPSLRDQNNSAAAVPDSAYSIVELDNLAPTGALAGPYVQIVDAENPHTTAADASQSLLFDRSQPQFEEVNAYFHIDRSLRYIESLGYSGARRLLNYVLPIDAHAANGTDNSYYVSGFLAGQGGLYFGDGGTDDAEDADIMTHELGHAIQDWIAPGTFTGSSAGQPRALGEGFGDYWAFSTGLEQSVLSGGDPYCIADWDARCFGDDPSQNCSYPEGATCLRRVDSTKTMRDYSNADSAGTEHRNGEIWSSALREIFLSNIARYGFQQGKRMTDTLAIEGTFGVPPNPTYATMAHKLLDADRSLYNGAASAAICMAMQVREILPAGGCGALPHGDLTLFPSAQQGIAIPDLDTTGITSTLTIDDPRAIDSLYVDVDIAHTARGDLQLFLTGPDGTTIALQHASLDRTANLRATFGLDTLSAESLGLFRFQSARGVWKLSVADVRPRDQGTLRSWGLIIRFAGVASSNLRPSTTSGQQTIAAVAHASGVNGTLFISDVRLFNRSAAATANVTLVFTPTGADGTKSFGAVKLTLPPNQLVQLSDIVAQTFRTTGTGQLEVQGDTDIVTVTSRTYTEGTGGTYGQYVGSVSRVPHESTVMGEAPLIIAPLEISDDFRTNVGLAEIGGGTGVARFTIIDRNGVTVDTIDLPITPYTHAQLALVNGRGDLYARLSMISGDARIAGYASVVDNHTGDATYIRGLGTLNAIRWHLPAIHADGANGTAWRTDLSIVNRSASETLVTVSDARANRSFKFTLAPGAMQLLRDVVASNLGGTGRAAVRVDSVQQIVVTSRTWTDSPAGSYGQFVEGIYDGGLASPLDDVQTVAGVDQNDDFRANIGLVAAYAPTEVAVTVFDAEGTKRGEGHYFVQADDTLQVPLSALISGTLTNGRVTFKTSNVLSSVYVYGSVIDNRSSDPLYIPAQ